MPADRPRRSPARMPAAPRRLPGVRRIVVKVGSGVIAHGGRLKPRVVAELAHNIAVLMHRGVEVILVASGAVASGYPALGFAKPPRDVLARQAAAAVGQPKMMASFARAFARQRIEVAQLLMSADDIEHRARFLSARHTLGELLTRGVVPIINENDALGSHEAVIGDNDHLSALITNVASAQLLILLSRVPGVLAGGPQGAVIPRVEVDSDIARHITRELSDSGVGGMVAKVHAARLAAQWGVPTIIADGAQPATILKLLDGAELGTMFVPAAPRLSARKRWIAFRARARGRLVIDAGAVRALRERGASLLASGVRSVAGDFPMGARVDIVAEDGALVALGLVSYRADEIRRVCGRKQAEIGPLLGYEYVREIVNRDDLVLADAGSADAAP